MKMGKQALDLYVWRGNSNCLINEFLERLLQLRAITFFIFFQVISGRTNRRYLNIVPVHTRNFSFPCFALRKIGRMDNICLTCPTAIALDGGEPFLIIATGLWNTSITLDVKLCKRVLRDSGRSLSLAAVQQSKDEGRAFN